MAFGQYGIYLAYAICLVAPLYLFWHILSFFHLINLNKPIASPSLNYFPSRHLATTELLQMHPFGEYNVIDPNALQKTALNLKLVGTFVAQPEIHSNAVISSGNDNQQKLYREGDVLYGDIKIHKILPDKVVLDNQGHLEVLLLPKSTLDFGPPQKP